MPTDFRTAISNFLADQGNQQMLQRMGTGAAVGAGGMALNDLLQGGEENETTGDRAGSLGRSMLLGGAMGGLGGLGYDQLDKHFLNDPAKTPGGAQVFSKPGQLWHSIRQMTPGSAAGGAGIGAVAGAGREAWRQHRMPALAEKLFSGQGSGVNENTVRQFLRRSGGWSPSSVQTIADHMGAQKTPTDLAAVRSALGSASNDTSIFNRGWQSLKNTARTLTGGSDMQNWRDSSLQVEKNLPGMNTTRATMGPNGTPVAMNPLISQVKDLFAKIPGATSKFPSLAAHRAATEFYRTGNSMASSGVDRAAQVHKAISQPGSYGQIRAIGKNGLKGGLYGALAQQAIQQLGRHSFDQLAMTPEAAAELARNPRFRQQ